ncbi:MULTISPECIES: hypothetical protein [Delftia]|uniref:hypothetical protein n=1 Tax=Delftia TaxID=80865 RepID=UPI00035287BC|nr:MULTISPECIES: hypothetical protein [Delftia]PZP76432.1 MAG: hypothetical protein DI604_00825 [Delftia acidovorans]EPD34103.1 hypothetical protein HMPREF9701_06295 [Delftia acidovorans CCUG 274B]MBS3722621.1 hypothetical protein [Delftia sp. PE138]MDH0850080.1 hypothetical protein [Delftia tsuruhatensis]WEM00718.1 hypothetical protein PW274_10630 [Delftia tsuruhatensis]
MPHHYAQLTPAGVAFAITETHAELNAPDLLPLPRYDTSVLGRRWTGTHWEDVAQALPENQAGPAAASEPAPRHITPHALRRRFTVVERTALEWAVVDRAEAGEADRLNAATLRSLLKDIEQARQLDLDDPELADSLRRFEAFGLIAAGRAQEILDGPVQAHEQP